ncbi:MAG TPA: hypothetical protein PKH07_20455, partial [bacterium]|nr:hypothetical protein [bacterium]
EFVHAVSWLKEAGFAASEIGAYVFVGYPGQTPEEAARACLFAHRQGILVKQTQYAPTPQSAIWERGFPDFRFDPGEDPLLQNCTLMPWRSDTFPASVYFRLRERINRWNALAQRGCRCDE